MLPSAGYHKTRLKELGQQQQVRHAKECTLPPTWRSALSKQMECIHRAEGRTGKVGHGRNMKCRI